jgi:shikimate dehydrogenase
VKCAVLGDPIEHSLSPTLHRAAYAALGLDWSYEAVRVPSGGLSEFVASMDGGWRGLSLTMPLKREVMPLLAGADEWVQATGACNTVVIEADGSWRGANTDVTGAAMALDGLESRPARALVLGGGATATSVLIALVERGLRHATLAVRNPSSVAETIQRVTGHRLAPTVEVRTLSEVERDPVVADIVVSTIPAAAQSEGLVASVQDIDVVFEILYDPWPTPLARAAAGRGQALITGLDLLVAQAVDQVRLMTGCADVPAEAMRAAADAVLAGRS